MLDRERQRQQTTDSPSSEREGLEDKEIQTIERTA